MRLKGFDTNILTGVFIGLTLAVIIIAGYTMYTKVTKKDEIVSEYKISGYSMYTPYKEGEMIFVFNKPKQYKRFDIVVFKQQVDGKETTMIKRLIGLPNEKVAFKDNNLYIDSQLIKQDFADSRYYLTTDFEAEVADGCVFVLGDNRRNSVDSRDFGCVKTENLQGVVLE